MCKMSVVANESDHSTCQHAQKKHKNKSKNMLCNGRRGRPLPL